MPRGNEVSEAIRNQIVGMRCMGCTFPAISTELGVDADTAGKIYNRWTETSDCSSAPRSGASKKLNEGDIRLIKHHVTHDREHRRQPLGEIIIDLNLSVSTKTLQRTLVNEIGLGHRIERKRCWLSPKQKEVRLSFAKKHIDWGSEEWRRVGFTDEMGMQTGANSKKVYVWRYPEEEYKEDCCGATVIAGFEKVKVWGAMRYGKLSELVVLPEAKGPGKLNAVEYSNVIMNGEMFMFWMEGMEEAGNLLMMEDGAPYHQGAASKRRKELEKDGWIGWGPGTWPSNSPDLNPIENLWHVLRSNVRKRKHQPRNRKELIEALIEEWKKLDMKIVNDLIDSMPRRMQAVIDAKGGSTKY
jgi:Transposase/DDE superfamily endonuclease